jgi:hypothetical protein
MAKIIICTEERRRKKSNITREIHLMWKWGKIETRNNRGKWNHLKIIQKITEQHTRKVRNTGTTENSHIGHCTRTSESAKVKVQHTQHGK